MPSSRGSSQPRDWTQVSCNAGGGLLDSLPAVLPGKLLRPCFKIFCLVDQLPSLFQGEFLLIFIFPLIGPYSLLFIYLFLYALWFFNFFYYFFKILFYFLILQYCIGFAIYQNESATGIHVFPILNPPPPSLPIPSPWVIPVHQPQASSIVHQTCTGDSPHIWYYTYSMPFSQIIPPSPSPTEIFLFLMESWTWEFSNVVTLEIRFSLFPRACCFCYCFSCCLLWSVFVPRISL